MILDNTEQLIRSRHVVVNHCTVGLHVCNSHDAVLPIRDRCYSQIGRKTTILSLGNYDCGLEQQKWKERCGGKSSNYDAVKAGVTTHAEVVKIGYPYRYDTASPCGLNATRCLVRES